MAKTGQPRLQRPELEVIASMAAELRALREMLPTLPRRAANVLATALDPLAADMVAIREAAAPAKKPEKEALDAISERLRAIRKKMPDLTRPAGKALAAGLERLMADIEAARSDLDPIKMPSGFFDPTDPDTAGRLVVLALIAQPMAPLSAVARTYGSGVYAIYYHGAHPAYANITQTETPIYVGKADPNVSSAKTPREQGDRLFGRLKDHRKMIRDVGHHANENGLPNPLDLADFTCRKLVCATNAQLVAERHLIGIFSPVWNQETNICWGISKHGDDAETRGNDRSPWDVLHPGRKWAMNPKLIDAMTITEILDGINKHLAVNPAYKDREAIVEKVIATFTQEVATTDPAVQEVEDEIEDTSVSADGDSPLSDGGSLQE
jgi:Eco29kI restriction endonuclease